MGSTSAFSRTSMEIGRRAAEQPQDLPCGALSRDISKMGSDLELMNSEIETFRNSGIQEFLIRYSGTVFEPKS